MDFKVGVLRVVVFLDCRAVFGIAFDFLIGVFFVSDLAAAFFLASALALLFEAGDFGAAMVLGSFLG